MSDALDPSSPVSSPLVPASANANTLDLNSTTVNGTPNLIQINGHPSALNGHVNGLDHSVILPKDMQNDTVDSTLDSPNTPISDIVHVKIDLDSQDQESDTRREKLDAVSTLAEPGTPRDQGPYLSYLLVRQLIAQSFQARLSMENIRLRLATHSQTCQWH